MLYEVRDTVVPTVQPERLLIDGVESDFWITHRKSFQWSRHPRHHTVIWKGDKGVYSGSLGWTATMFDWARRQGDKAPSVRVF